MNAIIISNSLIPSVKLCGHAQLSYLCENNKLNYRFLDANKINDKDLSWANIIIFLRSESYLEAYAAKLAYEAKKHLVYVLDDDLLDAPKYLSSGPYYNLKSTKENIREIMSYCTTFLTPSKVLKEKYGNIFKNTFLISEPSLDAITKKLENEKVKIGFAGSIDRTQDINEILSGALSRIIEEYKDEISVEFMGAHPEIVDKYNLKYIGYKKTYEKYVDTIKQLNWDIGLAPMPLTKFHECKYFNKYVEYASFGIAGIYTNCIPYIHGIKNLENGLLCDNNEESWYKAIKLLIDDKKLRKKIQKKSINEANSKYSLAQSSKEYLENILVGFNLVETKQEIVGIKNIRLIVPVLKIRDKIAQYGIRFPIWVGKYLYLKTLDILGIDKDE